MLNYDTSTNASKVSVKSLHPLWVSFSETLSENDKISSNYAMLVCCHIKNVGQRKIFTLLTEVEIRHPFLPAVNGKARKLGGFSTVFNKPSITLSSTTKRDV